MVVRPSYAPVTEKDIGLIQAQDRQNSRTKYWQEVLPFILEQTMGHRLAMVNYSKRTGFIPDPKRPSPIRNFPRSHPEAGKPIIIRNKKEIQEFMDRTGRFEDSGMGSFTKGLVTFFYVATTSGLNNRFMLFDFDIIDLPETSFRPKIVKVVELLEKEGYKALPVFTGSSWHVWAKMPDDTPIGDYGGIGPPATGVVGKVVEVATKLKIDIRGASAHIKGMVTVDYAINRANSPLRFPLSLHHKTGLVAIPLSKDEILKLDPKEDAHPEVVLTNLDKYKNRIKEFFTFNKYKDGDTKAPFHAPVFEEQVHFLKRKRFSQPTPESIKQGDKLILTTNVHWTGYHEKGWVEGTVDEVKNQGDDIWMLAGLVMEYAGPQEAAPNNPSIPGPYLQASFDGGSPLKGGNYSLHGGIPYSIVKFAEVKVAPDIKDAPVFEEQVGIFSVKRLPRPIKWEELVTGDVFVGNWTASSAPDPEGDYYYGLVTEHDNRPPDVKYLRVVFSKKLEPGMDRNEVIRGILESGDFGTRQSPKDGLEWSSLRLVRRGLKFNKAPVYEEQVDFLKIKRFPRPITWNELRVGDVISAEYFVNRKTYWGVVVEEVESSGTNPTFYIVWAEKGIEYAIKDARAEIARVRAERAYPEQIVHAGSTWNENQWSNIVLQRRLTHDEMFNAPIFEEQVSALKVKKERRIPHVGDKVRFLKTAYFDPDKYEWVEGSLDFLKASHTEWVEKGEMAKVTDMYVIHGVGYAVEDLVVSAVMVSWPTLRSDRGRTPAMSQIPIAWVEVVEEKEAPVFEEQVEALRVKQYPRSIKWDELAVGDIVSGTYKDSERKYFGVVLAVAPPTDTGDKKYHIHWAYTDSAEGLLAHYRSNLPTYHDKNSVAIYEEKQWDNLVLHRHMEVDKKFMAPVFEDFVGDFHVKHFPRPIKWEEIEVSDLIEATYSGINKVYWGVVLTEVGKGIYRIAWFDTKPEAMGFVEGTMDKQSRESKLKDDRTWIEAQWKNIILHGRPMTFHNIMKAPVFEELVETMGKGGRNRYLQDKYNCIAPRVIMKATESEPVDMVVVINHIKDECFPEDPPGQMRKDHMELTVWAIKNLADDGLVRVGKKEGDKSGKIYVHTDVRKVQEKIEEAKRERDKMEKKKAPVFEEQVSVLRVKHLKHLRPEVGDMVRVLKTAYYNGEWREASAEEVKKRHEFIIAGETALVSELSVNQGQNKDKTLVTIRFPNVISATGIKYKVERSGLLPIEWFEVVEKKKAPVFEEQVNVLTTKNVQYPHPVKWEDLKPGDVILVTNYDGHDQYYGVVIENYADGTHRIAWGKTEEGSLSNMENEVARFNNEGIWGTQNWSMKKSMWKDDISLIRRLTPEESAKSTLGIWRAPVFEEQVSTLTVKKKRIPRVGDKVRFLNSGYWDGDKWVEGLLDFLQASKTEWVEKDEVAKVTDVLLKHGGGFSLEDLVISVELITWPVVRSHIGRYRAMSQIPIAWVEVVETKESPPIRSKAQWRLFARNHPDLLKKWLKEHPTKYKNLPEKVDTKEAPPPPVFEEQVAVLITKFRKGPWTGEWSDLAVGDLVRTKEEGDDDSTFGVVVAKGPMRESPDEINKFDGTPGCIWIGPRSYDDPVKARNDAIKGKTNLDEISDWQKHDLWDDENELEVLERNLPVHTKITNKFVPPEFSPYPPQEHKGKWTGDLEDLAVGDMLKSEDDEYLVVLATGERTNPASQERFEGEEGTVWGVWYEKKGEAEKVTVGGRSFEGAVTNYEPEDLEAEGIKVVKRNIPVPEEIRRLFREKKSKPAKRPVAKPPLAPAPKKGRTKAGSIKEPKKDNPTKWKDIKAGDLVKDLPDRDYGVVLLVGKHDKEGQKNSIWAIWRATIDEAVEAFEDWEDTRDWRDTAYLDSSDYNDPDIALGVVKKGFAKIPAARTRTSAAPVFEELVIGLRPEPIPSGPVGWDKLKVGDLVEALSKNVGSQWKYGVVVAIGPVPSETTVGKGDVWAIWSRSESEALTGYRQSKPENFVSAAAPGHKGKLLRCTQGDYQIHERGIKRSEAPVFEELVKKTVRESNLVDMWQLREGDLIEDTRVEAEKFEWEVSSFREVRWGLIIGPIEEWGKGWQVFWGLSPNDAIESMRGRKRSVGHIAENDYRDRKVFRILQRDIPIEYDPVM